MPVAVREKQTPYLRQNLQTAQHILTRHALSSYRSKSQLKSRKGTDLDPSLVVQRRRMKYIPIDPIKIKDNWIKTAHQ